MNYTFSQKPLCEGVGEKDGGWWDLTSLSPLTWQQETQPTEGTLLKTKPSDNSLPCERDFLAILRSLWGSKGLSEKKVEWTLGRSMSKQAWGSI